MLVFSVPPASMEVLFMTASTPGQRHSRRQRAVGGRLCALPSGVAPGSGRPEVIDGCAAVALADAAGIPRARHAVQPIQETALFRLSSAALCGGISADTMEDSEMDAEDSNLGKAGKPDAFYDEEHLPPLLEDEVRKLL